MKKLLVLLISLCMIAGTPAHAFLFWKKNHHKKQERMRKKKLEAMRARQGYRTIPYDASTGHNEYATLSKKEQKKRKLHHLYPLTEDQLKHIKPDEIPNPGTSKSKGNGAADKDNSGGEASADKDPSGK